MILAAFKRVRLLQLRLFSRMELILSARSVTEFLCILISVSGTSNSFCPTVKTVKIKQRDPLARTTNLMLQPCIEGTLSFLLTVPCRAKSFVGFRRGPPGRGWAPLPWSGSHRTSWWVRLWAPCSCCGLSQCYPESCFWSPACSYSTRTGRGKCQSTKYFCCWGD